MHKGSALKRRTELRPSVVGSPIKRTPADLPARSLPPTLERGSGDELFKTGILPDGGHRLLFCWASPDNFYDWPFYAGRWSSSSHCSVRLGLNCWSMCARSRARGRIRNSTLMFCQRRSPQPGSATIIYSRSAVCGIAVRTQCRPPTRFGESHPSEIVPTTRKLTRSTWDWRN